MVVDNKKEQRKNLRMQVEYGTIKKDLGKGMVKDKSNQELYNKIKTNKKKIGIMPTQKYKEVLSELSAKYPKLFNKEEVKLLKVGIIKDILMDYNLTISRLQLRKFIRIYCSNNKYRELHKENAKRYDLNGNESGVVTKEHVEGLAKHREEIKNKWELRNKKHKEWLEKQKKKESSKKDRDSSDKNENQGIRENNKGNISSVHSGKTKLSIKINH